MIFMRNIRFTLEYIGTRYHGWQIQENAVTIQQVLEEKLGLILNKKPRVIGAGRTDAGVHALGQVAHFKTPNHLPIEKIFKGLNSLLPEDIAVLEMEEADPAFHSRKDAKKKEYFYQIWNGKRPSPFLSAFVTPVPCRLNIKTMQRAASLFQGKHDFHSFCPAKTTIRNKVRNVFHSEIADEGKMIRYRILADGFLHHMVRTIVGTLIDVGNEKIPLDEIKSIFQGKDRRLAGFMAPAKGLFLKKVYY
jgi:tRNA pseudouridine38-40 synthase